MIDGNSFQKRVVRWLHTCFGPIVAVDYRERNHRFLEEALELVQACGCTRVEAHELVDYVFSRPIGERRQETGGVMVTLAALCNAHSVDMQLCGETELARVWAFIETIRAKQATKKDICSPLPGMTFESYRLPDGRVVPVDATASRGQRTISFTLEGGAIVTAVKV